ncbi:MAG TPA: hypothetical protein VK186_20440 [Candidatus Deferrimicrobium sp.]|nr:hypothetical protein [Candidatus Kapabacteria bacterium]HLP61223.1 hypothetical protein [Candidatus Deferrimicrobium sp.]
MITESEVEEIIGRLFGHCLEPLSQISKDTANNEILIDDAGEFHNYDKIVQAAYDYREEDKPKSPDMILFKKNTVVFVEFKNGKITAREKDRIKLKAVEGGNIVLHHIVSQEKNGLHFLDTMGLKKSYVLVYNPGKNPFNEIHDRVYGQIARFGLHIYEGTFFNKVKTISAEAFSQWLGREEKD